MRVIYFEAGCAGGSVNRLFKLLDKWDHKKYPAGVFSFYNERMASRLLGIKGLSLSQTFGFVNMPLPDPLVRRYGLIFPTFFAFRYFFFSLITLLRYRKALIYINNTPYSHIPLIVAASLLKRRVLCHLRDTVSFTKIEKKLIKNISVFIALSEAAKIHYIAQGIDADKIRVIYDSVDIDSLLTPVTNRRTIEAAEKCTKIVVVGTLTQRKGQDVCIKALKRVVEKHKNVLLLLVGDGQFRPELENMARENGLSEEVVFTGHSERIPEILHTSNIGVLASRREGMPNSVMEYMAAGLPVVVTELSGIRELVVDKVTGFIIRQDSDEELADRLMELIEHPDIAVSMGEEGKKRIRLNRFSPETEMEGIVAALFDH
ncbi:MAG TPA: hypothetical protein DEG92_02960 [Rikenellaceae bacterium]|nr:hypothetical protein [Rikenellaceae bacterium]